MADFIKTADTGEAMVQCKKCRGWFTICSVYPNELELELSCLTTTGGGLYVREQHYCSRFGDTMDYLNFDDMILPGLEGSLIHAVMDK